MSGRRRGPTTVRWRHLFGYALSAALVATALHAPAAQAAPVTDSAPSLKREKSVPGRKAKPVPPAPDPVDAAVKRTGAAVSWPAPGTATVDLPRPSTSDDTAKSAAGTTAAPVNRVKAGSLPVSVGAPAGARTSGDRAGAAAPARVRVQVLDRVAAVAAQRAAGLLLRVGRADGGAAAGPVSVQVDYSAFRDAYGGDWAARLRLVTLPECALRTPDAAGCQGTRLPTDNDVEAGRLAADVTVAPTAEGTLLAVTAADSGPSGSFGVTPLSESATWSAGGNTGDFNWDYPLRVPPAPGGLEPELSLGYSSASVDGRNAATNNQPSWIGEGFDLWPGFIERRYKPCAEDRDADKNSQASNTQKTGDQCWATDNATLSLNGSGGDLIRDDATGAWKLRNDTGAKIERLTGGTNGDDNGEYWKVSTADGTQYYFGKNRLNGWVTNNAETNSTWTVPVYGNHATEPCRGTTFDTSWCDQAWRWNLDYVVDRFGDTMSYYYTRETNKYARNITADKDTDYHRGGTLDRIEYGQRDGAVYTTPAVGKVLLTSVNRCKEGTTCVKTDKSHWPDTPWDQECTGTSCVDKWSPTFWTAKRLSTITTQVWDAVAGRHVNVDSWTLRHSYPDPGDGTRAGLWLDGITHTGWVGGETSMPEVTFTGVQKPNRVDGIDGIPPMNWWRIAAIHSETGGELAVEYSGPECTAPGNLPTPASNTKRCMPVRWTPENLPERVDWFHKYVVTKVSEHDRTTSLQPDVTSYEYAGAAWRYTEADGITLAKYKTWSQWRGYSRVITREGDPAEGPVTKTETLYMQGMHGDKAASGTKTVTVTASEFGAINDQEPFAGFARETIVYLGDSSTVVSRSINTPWLSAATATAAHTWGTNRAYVQGTSATYGRQTLEGGGIRKTMSENTLGTVAGRPGVLTATNDLGDESTAADDKCVKFTYGDSTTRRLLDVTVRVVTYGVNCGVAAPASTDVLTDTRNYYDGSTTLGAIDRGNLTQTEKLVGFNGSTPIYQTTNRAVYDVHGRVKESYDSSGAMTKTEYTPLTGGPVTQVKTTNALGHEVTTELVSAWGEPKATIDPNGGRAEAEYDPLGRVARVWEPGRTKGTDTANVEYEYKVRTNGSNAVITKALKHDGTYLTSYQLFDGLMRERQTQAPAPGGGRVISDTVYNSRGEEAKENGPYFNDAPPGFDVFLPDEALLPAQTQNLYDGAGRPAAEIFKIQGAEQWRTTLTHSGDRVNVTRPAGGTATTTITDSRSQTVALRQYHGTTPTGTYDETKYTYTKRGELATVTDPDNNIWKYSYNVRGQKIREEDPDHGVTTYTYDDNDDELRSVTDARDKTIVYAYDAIGRTTAVHEGNLTGPKRAEWVYDTVAKGHLSSSTRWTGGNAYTSSVAAYDAAYRPLTTRMTIPAVEGNLAGTYESTQTYHGDGTPATSTLPAAGGLPEETVSYGYDSAFSLPTTLSSNLGSYVTNSTYTPYSEPWQTTTSTDATGATKWLTTTYEYWTGSRRLGRVQVDRDGTPKLLANAQYSWDAAGNLTKLRTDATNLASDTQCFKYDNLARLTSAWTPVSNNCTYAPSASLLGGPAPYYQSWTFDKTGNRKTQTTYATTTNTEATSSYPTPGGARPHALTSVTTTGPSGTRVNAFGYDASGNTVSRNLGGATQTLNWDAEGLLTSVTEPGKTTSFVYDADGNRLLRRDANGTTLYLGSNEVQRNTSGALSCTRYYGHQGRVVAVRESGAGNGTLTWLAADHHGTNTLAVRAADLSAQRLYSNPYGESRGPAPAWWPGDKGFVGGTKDASTGLTHLGAREYDPATGRFISVDPLIDVNDPQQMNGYAYANNAPTSASDPDGLMIINDGGGSFKGYCWPNCHKPPTKKPAKTQPPPKPKKCGTFDVSCKAKKAGNAVRNGAKKAGHWVAEHKTVIITVAVSVAAGIGCGIVTAGAAAVACAVGAGALISAAEYHFTTPASQRSVGGYFGAAAIGAVTGLAGLGIGKVAGAAIQAAAKAIGGGAKAAAQAAGQAAVAEAKGMAKSAANAYKSLGKGGGKGRSGGTTGQDTQIPRQAQTEAQAGDKMAAEARAPSDLKTAGKGLGLLVRGAKEGTPGVGYTVPSSRPPASVGPAIGGPPVGIEPGLLVVAVFVRVIVIAARRLVR